MEAHTKLTIDIPNEVVQELTKSLPPGTTIKEYIQQIIKQETEYITPEDAAKILHMAPSTLYRKTHEGVIPFYKPQGAIMFSRAELYAMIKDSRRHTKAEIKAQAAANLSRLA